MFQKIKGYFFMVKTLLIKIYNNLFKGNRLTRRGEELKNYLYKIVLEDYQPVTYAEFSMEKQFNIHNYTGEERRAWARMIYLELMKY